jgi:cytochrome c553
MPDLPCRANPGPWRGACAAGLLALLPAGGVLAQPAPQGEGIESRHYQWNAMEGEKLVALGLAGDAKRGEEPYAVCASCHLPSGFGRTDGTFPQLAGQHATVLIKQIADIRAGRRDNPIMYPFSTSLADPQELADVAAYLQAMPIPTGNGKGPGTRLADGERLYRRDCVRCHGEQGQGDAAKFYPVLAGQHYEYLLRQLRDIAGLRRRNADPEMVKVVKDYKDDELQAVADHASRLSWPERSEAAARLSQ